MACQEYTILPRDKERACFSRGSSRRKRDMTMIYLPLIKEHHQHRRDNSTNGGGGSGININIMYICYIIFSANYVSLSLTPACPILRDIEHKKRIKLLCPFYQ